MQVKMKFETSATIAERAGAEGKEIAPKMNRLARSEIYVLLIGNGAPFYALCHFNESRCW